MTAVFVPIRVGGSNLEPRIKSLSGARPSGFIRVRAAGQAGCLYSGERGRTGANCNPVCNPAG
jgi:hypothetical protein